MHQKQLTLLNLLNTDIVLLGDVHFGIKKFLPSALENQLVFFENQLFPFMQFNNIKTIIQVGDLFDHRTLIDIHLLQTLQTRFFNKLIELDIAMICVTGNHDMYHKNTRETTILSVVSNMCPNIVVVNEQTCVDNIGFVPFLVANESIDISLLQNSNFVFGHFEASGFEIANGVIDKHSSISVNTFSQHPNIQAVFSGHYHIPNTTKLLKYLGTPYQLSWGDAGNTHGFYVANLGKLLNKFEFIPNTYSKTYTKIMYDTQTLVINNLTYKSPISSADWKTIEKMIRPSSETKLYLQGSLQIWDEVYYREEYEYLKNLVSISQYSIIDNREEASEQMSDVFHNTPDATDTKDTISSTSNFIRVFIEQHHPDLLPILQSLYEGELGED